MIDTGIKDIEITEKDVDDALLFIIYLLISGISLCFPSLISMLILYISTIVWFNRVKLFDQFGRTRSAVLAIIIHITLPVLVAFYSVDIITYIINSLPIFKKDPKIPYTLLGYSYVFVPIALNQISDYVFKRHKFYDLNLVPALELGRMILWGTTLLFNIQIITEGIEDKFTKVSLLLIFAPMLLYNYGHKVTIEMKKSLKESESMKDEKCKEEKLNH